MRDIEKAKEQLQSGKYTCVLCSGDIIYTSTLRGVAPLVEWLGSGMNLGGFSAADKIVGKASAMLFVLAGVQEVYAPVMSEGAIHTLLQHGIHFSYDTLTESIINRTGTGSCPMEQAVRDIDEPSLALEAIKKNADAAEKTKRGGIPLKKLGFGFMRLPMLDSNDQSSIDLEQVCRMVDTSWNGGLLILIPPTCITSSKVRLRSAKRW